MHYYRKIRTYQEKRLNERDIEYVRGKRKPKTIRESWDDIPISWLGKMSWKSRTRKKKSWLRGKLKHRWWFLQELLKLESDKVDEAICHPTYAKWKYSPCYMKWEMFRKISEKDLFI